MTEMLARVSDVFGPLAMVWASRWVWTGRGAVALWCADIVATASDARCSRPGRGEGALTSRPSPPSEGS